MRFSNGRSRSGPCDARRSSPRWLRTLRLKAESDADAHAFAADGAALAAVRHRREAPAAEPERPAARARGHPGTPIGHRDAHRAVVSSHLELHWTGWDALRIGVQDSVREGL